MNMSLQIAEAGRPTRLIALANTQTIGRDTHNDIVLAAHTVSRYHAMLFRDGRAWLLFDLESTNGTLVNGVPLALDEPVRLADGDIIQFGQAVARIELQATTELAIEYQSTCIARQKQCEFYS